MTSIFSRHIVDDNPEKEELEPGKILRGPLLQPIVPPAGPQSSPTEKLLDWLVNHWPGPTVSARDIYRHGPYFIQQNPKSATILAEVLVENGWLTPLKSWRRDRKEWRIARIDEKADFSPALHPVQRRIRLQP
jgi:hypothetical protein